MGVVGLQQGVRELGKSLLLLMAVLLVIPLFLAVVQTSRLWPLA